MAGPGFKPLPNRPNDSEAITIKRGALSAAKVLSVLRAHMEETTGFRVVEVALDEDGALDVTFAARLVPIKGFDLKGDDL